MKDMHSPKNAVVSEEKPASDNSRRQFFKKATVGSALLSTVVSRPVWAVGCTVSGQMSGNLSDPTRDDCDAPATGKSPGYWSGWRALYNFFINNPGVKWRDLSNQEKNLFKFGGTGQAINVLYNWIIAADNSGGVIPYPAVNGLMEEMGRVLSPGDGSDTDFNYFGALLSVAHPNIPFPYPGNEWTLQYLIDNYMGTETHDTTHELVAEFFENHLEPTIPKYSGVTIGGKVFDNTKKGAFKWARYILGF